jgi:hypothetical protein
VKPNVAPANITVTPSVQSAYPSSAFTSLVTFQDEGSFVSVTTTLSAPRNNGATFTTSVTQSYTRLANGNWPEVRFTHVLPNDTKAGEHATLSVTVSDVRGLVSAPVTATVDIAADTIQPNILSVTPVGQHDLLRQAASSRSRRSSATPRPECSRSRSLVDGDSVRDRIADHRSDWRARRNSLRADRSEVESGRRDDPDRRHGERLQRQYALHDARHPLSSGANDPDAPKVTWLCPVDRGAMPALANNFALKLRLNVVDQDIRTVKFLIGTGGTIVNATLISAARSTARPTPSRRRRRRDR